MVIYNKKAKFNYNLLDRFEAGIALNGKEVKAAKKGSVDLSNSFVKIIDNEIYLVNANFGITDPDIATTRARKLLVHKRQIYSLLTETKAKKLTLVPTKLYNKPGLRSGSRKSRIFKLEVALAKGKKEFDKKESKKRKDIERDVEREIRGTKDNDARR